MSVCSGWNVHEMKAVKPPVSSWNCRTRSKCSTRSSIVSIWPNIIVAVDRPPSSCQTRCTFSQSSVMTLPRVIAERTRSTKISAPPPGRLPEPGRLEPLEHLPQRQLGDLGEVMNLRRAEPVNVDAGEVRLDVLEQLLIPLELQMRVQAPLHEDLVAPQRDRLANLVEQDVAIQDVSLGVVDFAVKRAKVADRRANVGVVDIAVDVVSPERLGMEPSAHLIGSPAQLQQRGRTEQFDALIERSIARRQRRGAKSRLPWKTRLTPSGARPSAPPFPRTASSPAISASPRS